MAFWWIEVKNGKLAQNGRTYDHGTGIVFTGGGPKLFFSKEQAQKVCRPGERPVKVRLVKYGEKVVP